MIVEWMSYSLTVAALVIVFAGGLRVGRLQEQDAERQRQAVARRAAALKVTCRTCGAAPGQPCVPFRHRVPTQRSPR